MHKSLASLCALLITATLSACSGSSAELQIPNPEAQTSTLSEAGRRADVAISSPLRQLSLRHWNTSTLTVTIDTRKKLRGPVTLRLERADGSTGDVIEVTPSTVTLAERGPTTLALKLRPTRVAFPADGEAQPWRLVASQGGREVGRLAMPVTLDYVKFRFTMTPVTAREGMTATTTLTVDADSRELPPFTFSLSPYIPEERTQYELVDDPQRPTQYRVNSLPASFQVPVAFKLFPGVMIPPNSAMFQLSVDGLDSLGSGRYGPKYVRADLVWNLAP